MIYKVIGASCLSALRPGHDPRPALDENRALGFAAVRVFCGNLPWCAQTLNDVYRNLPTFLGWARERDMHVYQAYHTEAHTTGYDKHAHTRELEAINAGRDNVLREAANEPPHSTNQISPDECRDLAAAMAGPVLYGADLDDESVAYAGGDTIAWHRNRSRDKWNDVRRQREGFGLMEQTHKGVCDQEGKGAAEQAEPGRRENDSAYFYAQAALARLFGFAGTFFHSSNGLDAVPYAPVQHLCAQEFIRGSRVWPTDTDHFVYKNVGHAGSPIVSATFNDGDVSKPGCTRSYSGILDGTGLNITIGISDMNNPGAVIGNGWAWAEELGRAQGVICRRVEYVGGRAHIVERQDR